jgi:hypothetical protein
MKKPTIIERFTDNGEHSHYSLIETETGDLLWSEAPEEETQQVKNLSLSDVSVNEVAVCSECGAPMNTDVCLTVWK